MAPARTFLKLLQQREDILAKFYNLFATIIQDDAVFWRMLAEGKLERARLLAPFVEQSEKGEITCTIFDRNYEEFEAFVDELNTLRSFCSMHYAKLSKKIMIQMTLFLEHISAKQSEMPLLKLDSPHVHKILNQISYELELGLETIDEFAHNFRIFYKMVPQSLADYRRILQPVTMQIKAIDEDMELEEVVAEDNPIGPTDKRFVRPKMSQPMSEFFVEKPEAPAVATVESEVFVTDDAPEKESLIDDYEYAYKDLIVKFESLERENEYLRKELEALRKIR